MVWSVVAVSTLPASFIRLARPASSPMMKRRWPSRSSSRRTLSTSWGRPAASTKSLRSRARSGLPSTGAATKPCPLATCSEASRRESPGLRVLIETWTAPAGKTFASPSSPSVTAATTLSSGREVTTTSQAARPFMRTTASAPASRRAALRSGLRSNTSTRRPSSRRLRAKADPMWPSPTTPTQTRPCDEIFEAASPVDVDDITALPTELNNSFAIHIDTNVPLTTLLCLT